MGVFKHLSDATRFRCSNYKAPGKQKCAHKLNLPLGAKTFRFITQPKDIALVAGKIDPVFHWHKMKFPTATVALALYLTICEGNPAPQVVKILRNLYAVNVSHDTITRWHHKAGFLFSAKTTQIMQIPQKPGRKPRLYADETELNGGPEKRWFWMSYCRKYDLMIGRNLTPHRDTQSARDLLAMTLELAPTLKSSPLLTDGLWSYPSAMGDLNICDDLHIRYKSFFELPNNNALERKWSNFKNRARPFRGIRSDVGKMAYIEGQIFYHNCLKPSVHLKGKTPYQNLNTPLPDYQSELELIQKLLTN
jgi:transposase-like protein